MVLTGYRAGYCRRTKEEERRLRSLTSWRRQGDSKGKPDGDGKKKEENGPEFGI